MCGARIKYDNLALLDFVSPFLPLELKSFSFHVFMSCSLCIVIFSARVVIGNIMHHVVTPGALFSAAGHINCNQDDNNISTFIILSPLQSHWELLGGV